VTLNATFVLLAAGFGGVLASAGCAARSTRATPVAVAPVPYAPAPAHAAAEEPISVPQTAAILPRPQPIQAEALAVAPPELPQAPPEPPAQPPKPRPTARTDSRPQTTQTQPIGPQPPPTRRRIRPVETASEQRRLQTLIADRQRQAQEILAKARARTLSEPEKNTVERIQAFLEQTDGALKEQDLELAEALSSRALLLSRELTPEK
jgi:hypothetical protein